MHSSSKAFTYSAGNVTREVGIRFEGEVALVTSFVVGNVYFAAIFNPQFTYYYVVNSKGDLGPCVVIASVAKNKMTHPIHFDLEVAPTKFGSN